MSCAPGRSWTWSWAKTPAPARTAQRPRPPPAPPTRLPATEPRATAPAATVPAARRSSLPARVPAGAAAGGFAGRVTLTVPLGTAAGLADRPGELAGLGPVDPWLARDLVNAAAASPKTTWCVTVTDQHGHAVGHGCARPEPTSHRKRAARGARGRPARVLLHPGQPGRAARRIRHLAADHPG